MVFIIIVTISKIIITKDIRIKCCILLQTFFQLDLKARIAWAQVLFTEDRIVWSKNYQMLLYTIKNYFDDVLNDPGFKDIFSMVNVCD